MLTLTEGVEGWPDTSEFAVTPVLGLSGSTSVKTTTTADQGVVAGVTILAIYMKQGLAGVLKAVTGIAGLVFLVAPFTSMGILVAVIALVVAIIAAIIGSHLSDDDNESGGYWPKGPNSSGSI